MNRHFGSPYQLSRYSEEYHAGTGDSDLFPAVWVGSEYETGLPWTKPASTWPNAGQWKTGRQNNLVSASWNCRGKFTIWYEEIPLPPADHLGNDPWSPVDLSNAKSIWSAWQCELTRRWLPATRCSLSSVCSHKTGPPVIPEGSERFLCSWVPAMSRLPGGSIGLATTSFPFWIRPPYH